MTFERHRRVGEYLSWIDKTLPNRRKEFSDLVTQAVANELARKRQKSSIKWLTYDKTWFYSTRDNKPGTFAMDLSLFDDYPYDILILRALHCSTILFIPTPDLLIHHLHQEDALATIWYFLGRYTPQKFGLVQKKKVTNGIL